MAETTTDPVDWVTIFAKHTDPTSAKMDDDDDDLV